MHSNRGAADQCLSFDIEIAELILSYRSIKSQVSIKTLYKCCMGPWGLLRNIFSQSGIYYGAFPVNVNQSMFEISFLPDD